jgi:hypothetical protein
LQGLRSTRHFGDDAEEIAGVAWRRRNAVSSRRILDNINGDISLGAQVVTTVIQLLETRKRGGD